MLGRWIAIALFVILTYFLFLVTAGHSRWAGETLIRATSEHGVNQGDVPAVAAWLVGSGCCWWIWQRQSPR